MQILNFFVNIEKSFIAAAATKLLSTWALSCFTQSFISLTSNCFICLDYGVILIYLIEARLKKEQQNH